MENLSIGDVASRAGIRPSAIRYYESVGLLAEPSRVNGRRRYGPDVLTRLTVIRMAQEAGLSVAEMRTLFHGFPEAATAASRWRSFAERKLGEMDAIIARAQRMRGLLEESMRCGCLTLDDCAVVGWPGADEPARVTVPAGKA